MTISMSILAINLTMPIMMTVFGTVFLRHTPKDRNGLWGYRTPRSRKSNESWDFANKKSGEISKRNGKWLLIFSCIASLYSLRVDRKNILKITTVICLIQIISVLASVLVIEKSLKKNFDEDGRKVV